MERLSVSATPDCRPVYSTSCTSTLPPSTRQHAPHRPDHTRKRRAQLRVLRSETMGWIGRRAQERVVALRREAGLDLPGGRPGDQLNC